ncbi:MAG: transcriptional regulator [Verrucomicrobia bacterium]|nr:transcriptional regulator [Verrucomicrobiota bacterium]MBV8485700.1 transcriptional regulator [Verrucomicrobiota bacterium]
MSPRKRILDHLKSAGPTSAGSLGEVFGITKMAALQHLHAMELEGVVKREAKPGVSGRPTFLWSLTAAAAKFFPDAHAELAVSLIACLNESLGPEALDKLIKTRSRHQLQSYRREIEPTDSLRQKLEALAAIRSREGYMAGVEKLQDRNGYLLVEKHCPICIAATNCTGLCREELNVFRKLLGNKVEVKRTEHIVAGALRCAYLVRPVCET